MKVLFLLDAAFDGNSLTRGLLGGTETALIGSSRALARLPNMQVYVCADVDKAEAFDGVHYFPLCDLATWAASNVADVFFVIRSWIPLWLPLKARRRIYFSPDAFDQPSLHSAADATLQIGPNPVRASVLSPTLFYDAVDAFFCVGQWQRDTFVLELNMPADKMYVTGNGVFPENFSSIPLEQRSASLIYSATPFRGLEYLPAYFMELRTNFPRLALEVCSGLGVYGKSREEDVAVHGDLYESLSEAGATLHGSVQQRDLATIMCRSRIYAYPNTFAETFCISVLEAQMAGLPVVTSKLGALPERIEHGVDGYLIDGHPSEDGYRREFLAICSRLLSEDDLWHRISDAAASRARNQSYEHIASTWKEEFSRLCLAASPTEPSMPPLPRVDVPIPGSGGKTVPLEGEQIAKFLPQLFQRFGFNKAL